MAIIGYARTSTTDQSAGLEDQLRVLTEHGCERIFSEHISATVENRPELTKCLEYVREGDTFIVTKPDRLARSVVHMLALIDRLRGKGVHVRILSMGVDTSSPTGNMILTILAAVAQWEREIMLERQRAGIEKAKAEGKFAGRKPVLSEKQVEWARKVRAEGMSKREIMAKLGCSESTFWRATKGVRLPEPTKGESYVAV